MSAVRYEKMRSRRASMPHRLQLFDGIDSLSGAVSAFVREGMLAGDTLLVVTTSKHWSAVVQRFPQDSVSLENALQAGQLVVRDADYSLQLVMRGGLPDRELFDSTMGTLVRQLSALGKPLRVYGETANLLVERGELESAERLERHWSRLAERNSIVLLCGYLAVNFGDPATAHELRSLCQEHSHVICDPEDLLGTFLLSAYEAQAPSASVVSGKLR